MTVKDLLKIDKIEIEESSKQKLWAMILYPKEFWLVKNKVEDKIKSNGNYHSVIWDEVKYDNIAGSFKTFRERD